MKKKTNIIRKFKSMRLPRKVSFISFIIILVLIQLLSLMSLIGIATVPDILNNIKIPSGYVFTNIDTDYPEDMVVSIPYDIVNKGIYDLTEMRIEAEMYIVYVNQSNSLNITRNIFAKSDFLPDCKGLQRLSGIFLGNFYDFNINSLVRYFEEVDPYSTTNFFLNLNFSTKYFFNLISLQTRFSDLNLLET